jgi:glycosyltransferase involved in cell wall biosynthesis
MTHTLVLYSRLAFYPVHWLALEEIVRRYDVHAVVLAAAPPADLPTVHQAHGTAGPPVSSSLPIEVRRVPAGSRTQRLRWIASQLRAIRPDVIWVQEEPIDPFLLEMLAMYRFRRRPRIVTAVCENIFPRPRLWAERAARRLLWPRLDHLLTVARPSLEGIRAAGMPGSVPASTLVAGGLEPEGDVTPMPLPGDPTGFTVGFAGRIIEPKGWRVLVRALPEDARLVLAGDGPQRAELDAIVAQDERIHYHGLLPKGYLWSFYAALDCLAVPSLTTPRWKEQSASTLVDGLCMGLPIVASDSGGIPDIMGPAGILVPEGDPDALMAALERVRDDAALRERLGAAGRERFRREFAIPAYADKIASALNLHVRSVALAG